MFTGIVAELGRVERIEPGSVSARLIVAGDILADVTPGESVAVNGVCLTAVRAESRRMTADVMAETLNRSTLGSLVTGAEVNLERPVTPASLLGGHVVQGHVDGVGTVVDRLPGEGFEVVTIDVSPGLTRYVVEKGSIALDGVSLTVTEVADQRITVGLIPETLRRTTLGRRAVGDRVNVEVDVLAKYVERLLANDSERLPAAGATDGGVSR